MNEIVPFSREFPLEILVHILFFASPSTLATCAQLSNSFFELAAFQLWKEIDLFRPQQLHFLFRRSMKRHRSQITPLPSNLAFHLSLRHVQHLILDGSLLRTSISLIEGFGDPLVPKRMVITNAVEISSPPNSIFQRVRPLELVYVCLHGTLASKPSFPVDILHLPRGRRSSNIVVVLQGLSDRAEWAIGGRELLNLVFGIALPKEVEVTNRVEEDLKVRFVLKPSNYQEGFEKFLKVRQERDCLDAAFFGGREGAVVVEVADEKARGWVESGKAFLSEEQKALVRVEVGQKGWEHWVGCN